MTHAVAPPLPVGLLQQLCGLLEVELPAGIGRPKLGGVIEIVTRRLGFSAGELLGDGAPIDGGRKGLPHPEVGEEGMRHLDAAALAIHLGPGVRAMVPSRARPPLSKLGTSAARIGMKVPSGSMESNGSETSRAASRFFVAASRWALRIVGACHHSSRSFPPPLQGRQKPDREARVSLLRLAPFHSRALYSCAWNTTPATSCCSH